METTQTDNLEKHVERELVNVSEIKRIGIPMVGADLEIYKDMKMECTYLKNPIKMRAHLSQREIHDLSNFTKSIYPHPDIVRVDINKSIGAIYSAKLLNYFGNGNGNGDGKEYKEVKPKVPGTDEKSERILRMYASHLLDHYSIKQ